MIEEPETDLDSITVDLRNKMSLKRKHEIIDEEVALAVVEPKRVKVSFTAGELRYFFSFHVFCKIVVC